MDLQTLQDRKKRIEEQRAQLLEDANRKLAMLDGALLLVDELIDEMEAAGEAAAEPDGRDILREVLLSPFQRAANEMQAEVGDEEE